MKLGGIVAGTTIGPRSGNEMIFGTLDFFDKNIKIQLELTEEETRRMFDLLEPLANEVKKRIPTAIDFAL